MRLTHKIRVPVILGALAVGCSAGASDTGADSELTAAAQTQALSSYSQQVSDTDQSITFTGPAGTQWVDVHFTINSARSTNVRMESQGGSFVVSPLPVVAGDVLSYSFTYSANGVVTDTPVFQHTFPSPWVPPAFRTSVSGSDGAFKISATSTRALAWVDAHYQVNDGPQLNVRMQAVSGGFETPVTMHAGDKLSYSLTYSTGAYVLETALASNQPAPVTCERPALGKGSVCDLGTGSLMFQVTLPSGQAYVEVFGRQNGQQNLAQNILGTGSVVVNGDGTATYSLTRAGYSAGDQVDYRFYSYLPASPGVFIPGPTDSTWLTTTVGSCETFSVPVDGTTVPSQAYRSGSTATIDVSGTVKWGDCNSTYCPDAGSCGFNRIGDAQFHSDNCFTGSNPTYHNPSYDFPIQLFVDGAPLPTSAYSTSHEYSLPIAGTGSPFQFRYADCSGCYGDNTGSFSVKVCGWH